jgi:hypothetical protein
MNRRAAWWPLAEWTAAFGLLTFAVLGAASIGIFVLPFAAGALIIVARRDRAWPEAPLGGLIGVGALSLVVGLVNLPFDPCPPGGIPMVLERGETFRCGGRNPIPWLVVGSGAIALGLIGYFASRRGQAAPRAT